MTAASPPVSLESQLSFPLGQTLPELGQVLQVAPGILWLRMNLPFALDHINLWLLRDEQDGPHGPVQGWTAVDCGVCNDNTQAAWEKIFASALEGLPILKVVVTHMHPDHMGMAHWLCERWQAPLYISSTEFQAALLASSGGTNFGGPSTQAFFAVNGWTQSEDQLQVGARVSYYAGMVPLVPQTHHRLMHETVLHIGGRDWRCISGFGHSPEHMALYCEPARVLISGDMVLPKISTNVSVYAQEPEGNALALFLASLKKFDDLPEDTLVLPSHGRPFKGLHTRTSQLHAHHQERLAEVMQACAVKASSAHDMLPVIFKRPLNFHQTTFAMGESVAHLHLLWYSGQLKRRQDAQGVWRFSPN